MSVRKKATTRPGMKPGRPLNQLANEQEPEELISPDRLLRYLDASERAVEGGGAHYADHLGDPGDADEADEADEDMAVPQILAMPDGIKVDERLVGRAVAQWILQVRCDCGRRWFEVEVVDTATCPRCGMLVYVDLDVRGNRRRADHHQPRGTDPTPTQFLRGDGTMQGTCS